MRVLVIPPAMAATHLLALVPLCWALRSAGHELLVAGPADIEETTLSAGLGFIELGSAKRFEGAAQTVPEDTFPAPEWAEREDADRSRVLMELIADMQSTYAIDHLADYRRFAEAWRPDLVLADHTAIIARPLGGVLGVPTVTHRWGVDPTGEAFRERARRQLGPLCAELGLPELPDPEFIIDPCPPSLQHESAVPGIPMRYLPFNGPGVFPQWALTGAGRKRVCLCPGRTLVPTCGPAPVLRAVAALDGIPDVETTVALTAADRERVGPLPASFRVVEQLPLNLFLGGCDLVVLLGGGGVGLTATSFGLPQVVLPQWFDQFDYGRRIEEAGAGLSIGSRERQADIDGLRQAFASVLEDPGFTAGARRLRDEIESAPPPSAVVAELERLVRASTKAA
ncbi:nucleotide disphospho-sugar-binding domain-containing protein [Amycolatopsis sp. NPDC059027]|uniref:nucleotide disphospho-sugar-binding domain-containing protein n=1 Tax=Amycolatopsis sp. NPDC059027 TaxID=3346709 RepID=UPI003671065F